MGWFIEKGDGTRSMSELAADIDLMFANSPAETKTNNEAAFAEEYAKQFGNIALIVTAILGAVFFTILLVNGNTMAQSVRERIPELAVLKTLGFGSGSILTMVLLEGILIVCIGGLAGITVAKMAIGLDLECHGIHVAGRAQPKYANRGQRYRVHAVSWHCVRTAPRCAGHAFKHRAGFGER